MLGEYLWCLLALCEDSVVSCGPGGFSIIICWDLGVRIKVNAVKRSAQCWQSMKLYHSQVGYEVYPLTTPPEILV